MKQITMSKNFECPVREKGEKVVDRMLIHRSHVHVIINIRDLKRTAGSADLKISKSALLSFNHHNFSNTKPIYTE